MTGQYGLADLTDDRYAYLDEDAMKQVQICRPRPKTAPKPIDTRTPSGRVLPF